MGDDQIRFIPNNEDWWKLQKSCFLPTGTLTFTILSLFIYMIPAAFE